MGLAGTAGKYGLQLHLLKGLCRLPCCADLALMAVLACVLSDRSGMLLPST